MPSLTETIQHIYHSQDPYLLGKYREGFYDAIDDLRLRDLDESMFLKKHLEKIESALHYAYVTGYNAKAITCGLPSLPYPKTAKEG